MDETRFAGIDLNRLQRVLARGVDHGNNLVQPYVDDVGGWPLRCCLEYSEVGEKIALIAWCPFTWKGVYAETGPIFVHASQCAGPATDRALPDELNQRAMVLRPYTHDRRIAYDHVRHVAAGQSLSAHVKELLANDVVDFVHGRNVTGGCFSFTAQSGQNRQRDCDRRESG